jgi:hypothetical protein
MTSKIGNSSLRNSMYRHPQMVPRTKIFAGQDSNSSATYLRWLGPVWEQAHKGDVPEQYLPWKREYLPVGLANGAAGSHIGLDSFWKYAGGSQDVAGDVIDPLDIFNNSTYDSTEFDQVTGTGVDNIIKYDYPADNPHAGQAYANTSYNDQIGANRFGWPYGEYQPVFGDAGGGKSFWRTFPQSTLGEIDMWHPMEFNADGSNNLAYRRDGSSNPPVGYINGKWAKEYSTTTGQDTIYGINPFWIYNVSIEDSYLASNPPYDISTFIFRIKPGSLDNPYYTDSYGDFPPADSDTAQMLYWLGYDPDDLIDLTDTMTFHVTNNNTNQIFEYTVPVSKLLKESSGKWGFFGGDFTPNLPNGNYPYENGEWDGGLISFQPLWGTDPVIQWKFRRHKAWDVRPLNWGMTMGSEEGKIIGETSMGWQFYYPHGHVERQPEIRTSTRSVLLYDLTPTIPSGAPIMKAELFLTSKARTNWPDNQLADDWPTDVDELTANETGPRRYKVGAGTQYQLSLLHPLTTKRCTWGTYDGTNAWTDLIANTAGNQTIGGTCSILPNVFNLGSGLSGEGGQDAEKWRGLGWRDSNLTNGDSDGDGFLDSDESISIHDNRVAYQRFNWESNDLNVSTPSKFQINAVTAGSPVEIAGITGGGVMVVPSRKEEVGPRNTNGHATHPSDGLKRGFMGGGGNTSKFTQGEIVAATGRRYGDVKDFDMTTGTGADGSKVVLDVTDMAKYAVNNLGGKMRLAITGKTLNGAAVNEDPHDKWKSESTWSHYAYQYYPRYKIDHNGVVQSTQTNYGGGIGDADGTARAQFPQCGPHTVRTEFYSMNDESNSEEFEEIQFKNALQSGTSSYDDVIDMTDLITDFQALASLDIVQNSNTINYAKITQYGNTYTTESSRGKAQLNFKIQFNTESEAPTSAEAEALGFNAWMEKAIEMRDRLAVHDQNNGNDTIKIVCPKIVGSNGEIVTIGEDDIGTDSESIGYKLNSQGANLSYYTGLPIRLKYISFFFKLDYPVVDGLIPADGKTLTRHYGTGENYYPHASGAEYFNGYFLGDLSSITPTLGENSEWATSLSAKFDEIPVDNSLSNYICSEFSVFPVSAVGDAFGITHDIPAGQGITHDNRGAYSVKSIIEPNIIEVNETVTKQFIDNSDDSYGTIKATNFSNRPYLKITYSEQEDYGV